MSPIKSPAVNTFNTPVKSTIVYDNVPDKSPDNVNNYYLKSPIGKILVEKNDTLSSNHQNHFIGTSSQPVMNSPVDETMKTYKRALFMSEPSKKTIKGLK